MKKLLMTLIATITVSYGISMTAAARPEPSTEEITTKVEKVNDALRTRAKNLNEQLMQLRNLGIPREHYEKIAGQFGKIADTIQLRLAGFRSAMKENKSQLAVANYNAIADSMRELDTIRDRLQAIIAQPAPAPRRAEAPRPVVQPQPQPAQTFEQLQTAYTQLQNAIQQKVKRLQQQQRAPRQLVTEISTLINEINGNLTQIAATEPQDRDGIFNALREEIDQQMQALRNFDQQLNTIEAATKSQPQPPTTTTQPQQDPELRGIVATMQKPATVESQPADGKRLIAQRLVPVNREQSAALPTNNNSTIRQAPALIQLHETAGIPDVTNYCGYYTAFNAYNLATNQLGRILDRTAFANDFYRMLVANKTAHIPAPYDNLDEQGVTRNIQTLTGGQQATPIVLVEREGMLPLYLAKELELPNELTYFINRRTNRIVLIYGFGALGEHGLGGQQHWVTILAERTQQNHLTFTVYDSLLNNWLAPEYMNNHLKYIDELLRGIKDETLFAGFQNQ